MRRSRLSAAAGFLACGAFLVATGCLLLLLWRYVPVRAAMLEGLEAPLPLVTRLTIAASMWTVRLLPLMVLVGAPLSALVLVGLGVLATVRPGAAWILRVGALVLAVAAGLEILVCGLVVYAMALPS
jgi:type II secretory pathway component PulF